MLNVCSAFEIVYFVTKSNPGLTLIRKTSAKAKAKAGILRCAQNENSSFNDSDISLACQNSLKMMWGMRRQ
jgi:hypothetical protein